MDARLGRQFLCGFILLISSCAMAGKKVPDWVLNPIPDSGSYMYGVAEGKSLNSATQSALESVAGRLLTSISSDHRERVSANNDKVDTQTDIDIRSQVGNTQISGYEVDKTKKSRKTYYVRVKVDKYKLLESNKSALESALTDLDEYLSPGKAISVLKVFKKRRKLERKIKEASQKSMVVQALTDANHIAKYTAKINQYQQTMNQLMGKMVIYIEASRDLAPLARKLIQELSVEDVRATTTQPDFNSPIVRLNGSFTRGERFGQKYVNANTAIDVYDEFGNPLSSKQLIVDGQAYLSHESAITSAINKTVNQMSEEGVTRSLGLN